MGSQETVGVVMVAVSKHASSLQAVKWTLSNKIVPQGSSLMLVHVRPVLRSIPTPKGNLVPKEKVSPEIVATYRRDLHSKTKQDLEAHKNLCDASKVEAEFVIAEGDDVADSLLDQAFRLGANKFIIGKSTNSLLRKLRGRHIPDIVGKCASRFCTVLVISNGKLVSVKDARSPSLLAASDSSAHFLHSDLNISDLSGGILSGSDSSGSLSAHQAGNSDVSMVVREDFHSQHGISCDFNKLKLEHEHCVLKIEQLEAIVTQNATDSDICAKEEARKGEWQALLEAQLARQELSIQLKSFDEFREAARLAREEEAQRHKDAEDQASQLLSNSQEVMDALQQANRYREYEFEELRIATNGFSETNMIGRGGYGHVYKGKLHHIRVAIKVLDKNSIQGPKEFQQEVEFLSRMHHPHIVLLLGACPEQGCLVYEYLANGSLEDCLQCTGNAAPLPWHTRFRIAAEIATALLFLHSLKPNPYVHRDLKPANILLDHNCVSKLGDVGLAALAPSNISYDVTLYRETIPVGTPAYIDPAYQRTGAFTPRSDVYAFGLILLQLLTGKGPLGLPTIVEVALNEKTLERVLDPTAGDWPTEEATELACIALQCSMLEPRNRTDIQVILPRLEKLATFADDSIAWMKQNIAGTAVDIPSNFFCPISKVIMENPHVAADGYTYELAAIKQWLQNHKSSPKTNMKLQHKHLIPNHTLRLAILEWKQQLPSSVGACQIQLI
eukprot:c21113_g1_i1 orf=212-2392(+)